MMRLLFLCLLLPAATVASTEDEEGSGDLDSDDEDYAVRKVVPILSSNIDNVDAPAAGKTTGVEGDLEQSTLIVIVAAVSVVALSIAVIVVVVLVRRHMHNRQQGIYSVPAEQGLKGAV